MSAECNRRHLPDLIPCDYTFADPGYIIEATHPVYEGLQKASRNYTKLGVDRKVLLTSYPITDTDEIETEISQSIKTMIHLFVRPTIVSC